MKKQILAGAIGTVLAIPGVASAIELTDYTNPVSEWDEAFIEGKLNTKSGNQDRTSYDLNAIVDWESVYSSLPRTWRIQADGTADVSRGPNSSDVRQENVSANLAGNVDNYFNNDNRWFWYGAGQLGYLDDAEDEFVKVGAGLGYGRVINATPLAKVLRIEEELREHDVIVGEISDETYLQLAEIIERENQFRSEYGADEYKPHFFAEFENVLQKAGHLKDGSLGATGALFMDRVLYDERISVRKHGWVVRGGAGLVIQDYSGTADNDPSIDLVFEYAKPYGYRGQFDNILSYSTIFADDTDQLWRNIMTYTYEISDRIDWENAWVFDYFIAGGNNVNDILSNSLASTVRYYLTNRVSAGVTVSATKVDDDINGNGNDETDIATFFDVRYRLK